MKRQITLILLLSATAAFATDIEGVQPAALDQPRVHMHLRREAKGKPLTGGKDAENAINIQAFLDTGASGILLSKTTADALGVKVTKAGDKPIVFHDVGVAGGDQFNVSEPLYFFIAPFGKTGEPADADGYPLSIGPARAQLGVSAGMMDMLTGGLDVVGMPAIKGHVMVLDPKPVDTFGDTMRAVLLSQNEKQKIPKTDRHIAVTFTSFERFTRTEPANAKGPTLATNPMIGGVVVTHNGKRNVGNWLFDTGAAASIISKDQARKLGVTYDEDAAEPKLKGAPDNEQFSITIGGIGGTHKSAGFFLDTLTLPTREKDPIVYRKAPVLVSDITVIDEKTKEKLTLDGVFGMNYLVGSAHVSEAGLLPDIKNLTAGPFDWIVFDEPAAMIGVKLKSQK